ncbi:hypothetical protein BC781_107156 [Sediminitomix flava]|uniref:Uncharacterized protein n=1 Tax=Sediminitomix flava TaxID=379075 RepID=A0A315Z5Z4_SEDFL|nr:hypothetical protein BC781_107156 [Sediminitomix flava]
MNFSKVYIQFFLVLITLIIAVSTEDIQKIGDRNAKQVSIRLNRNQENRIN